MCFLLTILFFFFFQAEDGIRDRDVTGVQTCALPICLPRRSATVVEGSTGIGKTLLGLHFLLAGARAGEPGILLTLEETPEQLWGIGKGFGWDLAKLERQQRLFLHYSSPVELSTDRFLNDARQRVERVHARRVVLDSLTSLALGVASARRFRELIHAMTKHFRAAGVTVLMTSEVPDLP